MALGDLFKSKKERERDETKRRREAFRKAEGAVDVVKERISKLKKDRDKAWGEARSYLKDGHKAAAQRCLQTCRSTEVLSAKLEMKRWVFEQLLAELEIAKSDQEFKDALGAINTVVQIDPESVADVLGEVQDKLGEQVDTDKIWEKVHGKKMEGIASEMTDLVPSIAEMEKQLDDEVAADVRTSRPTGSSTEQETGSSVKDQIGEGRRRLRALLEGDNK